MNGAAAGVEALRATATVERVGERTSRRLADAHVIVGSDMAWVEAELARAASDGVRPGTLASAHLLDAGGKRVRPLAVLLSAACFGEVPPAARALAVVAELVHAATLLHDDVIDDADERRGRPASRRIWGNAVSVLAGDLLLTHALERTIEAAPRPLAVPRRDAAAARGRRDRAAPGANEARSGRGDLFLGRARQDVVALRLGGARGGARRRSGTRRSRRARRVRRAPRRRVSARRRRARLLGRRARRPARRSSAICARGRSPSRSSARSPRAPRSRRTSSGRGAATTARRAGSSPVSSSRARATRCARSRARRPERALAALSRVPAEPRASSSPASRASCVARGVTTIELFAGEVKSSGDREPRRTRRGSAASRTPRPASATSSAA